MLVVKNFHKQKESQRLSFTLSVMMNTIMHDRNINGMSKLEV